MKIVAIPRNGIGNRMQMLSSAYNLSQKLTAEFVIHWTEQTVFRSSFDDIFEEIPKASLAEHKNHLEISEFNLPQFTNYDKTLNRITMKNFRLGDQFFMPELKKLLRESNENTEIWIESGEKFDMSGGRKFKDSSEFRYARLDFYNQIKFNSNIMEMYHSIASKTGPRYWAIHIRGTDRNSESISNSKIMRQVKLKQKYLREVSSTVYIASDDIERGLDLSNSLLRDGYKVVFDPDKNRDRLTTGEAQESVVDWLVLKNAFSVISYGGTTYSYEAVVAGGTYDARIHLKPTIFRQIIDKPRREFLFLRLYGKFPYSHSFISR